MYLQQHLCCGNDIISLLKSQLRILYHNSTEAQFNQNLDLFKSFWNEHYAPYMVYFHTIQNLPIAKAADWLQAECLYWLDILQNPVQWEDYLKRQHHHREQYQKSLQQLCSTSIQIEEISENSSSNPILKLIALNDQNEVAATSSNSTLNLPTPSTPSTLHVCCYCWHGIEFLQQMLTLPKKGTYIPMGWAVTDQMVNDMAFTDFSLVIHAGDVCYAGTGSTWEIEAVWDLWGNQMQPLAAYIP